MRMARSIFAVLCLAAGVLIGVLNRDAVVIDLGLVELRSTLGLSLICALLFGVLIGGAAVALGMRRATPAALRDARESSRSEA
jgi:lipopolysaccharide assembly protein A